MCLLEGQTVSLLGLTFSYSQKISLDIIIKQIWWLSAWTTHFHWTGVTERVVLHPGTRAGALPPDRRRTLATALQARVPARATTRAGALRPPRRRRRTRRPGPPLTTTRSTLSRPRRDTAATVRTPHMYRASSSTRKDSQQRACIRDSETSLHLEKVSVTCRLSIHHNSSASYQPRDAHCWT